MVSRALPAPGEMMRGAAPSPRPGLILYTARDQYAHKNAVAATLAWVAEAANRAFEVYYDAFHAGLHYGGGDPRRADPGLLTGGLVSGARHLEAVALALQRFQALVICSGQVACANTLATLGADSGAEIYTRGEENVAALYEAVFSALQIPWPDTAVMVQAAPTPDLEGIDAYCYPEIFYRRALGIEATAQPAELQGLSAHGVRHILTCGVAPAQQDALRARGFTVSDLDVIRDGDDYAAVTARLAQRWQDQRQGWVVGDPALVSSWLPTACRERRAAIYSIPQSRVIALLKDEIAAATTPLLGRQFEDSDFFTLSQLGQSFQLVDPCRPPLPVLQTVPSRWSTPLPDPRATDPSDEDLRDYARQGRVLISLVFWTGMLRETENLFALMDLLAMTGLSAGLALTAQSLAYRPSPLDLLSVPRTQGGVFPHAEILLASCGTGAAIESLLPPDRLGAHLHDATRALAQLGLPRPLWPQGWWATMDALLVPLAPSKAPKPVRWRSSPPYVQVRYHRRGANEAPPRGGSHPGRPQTRDARSSFPAGVDTRTWQRRVRTLVRESPMSTFFEPYRPYERFGPGPILPELAATVRRAGFTYMLTKSGFGQPPQVMYQDQDFVALNYTAGQWDGWTPFETINDVRDLKRAERALLARGAPGWLLGSIDTCLWAFSGALWEAAPGLAAIARYAAAGGSSGKLINVSPRVLARYARLIGAEPILSASAPADTSATQA